jgi:hypothetical protein
MENPVSTVDGQVRVSCPRLVVGVGVLSGRPSDVCAQTYERRAIEMWFSRGFITSPATGLILSSKNLIPANALKKAIVDFLAKHESFRREPETPEEVSALSPRTEF